MTGGPLLTRAQAEGAIGGLSHTRVMPGPSFGLPIEACSVGAELRARAPDSPCRRCYAARYRPSVLPAQRGRLGILRAALEGGELERARYAATFARALEGIRWFRWFDSGDLQGAAHAAVIAAVAELTPTTRHWLPTQERAAVLEALELRGGELPGNLTVRVSSARLGEPAALPPELAAHPRVARSAVSYGPPVPGHRRCGKVDRGRCGGCRACWDPRVDVWYPGH